MCCTIFDFLEILKVGARLGGWLSDYTATLRPILQAETCQIFSQAEIQDRLSVAITIKSKANDGWFWVEILKKNKCGQNKSHDIKNLWIGKNFESTNF